MCICICICMYGMYVCMYEECMYVCMYLCLCVCVFTYICKIYVCTGISLISPPLSTTGEADRRIFREKRRHKNRGVSTRPSNLRHNFSKKRAFVRTYGTHTWVLTSDFPPPQPSAGSCASGSDFSIVKRVWGWVCLTRPRLAEASAATASANSSEVRVPVGTKERCDDALRGAGGRVSRCEGERRE